VVLYLAAAAAAAAALGVLAAIEAVATYVWRLCSIVLLGVRARGGDQRVPCPPEPAFEIYFGGPLLRDFRAAFGVAMRDVVAQARDRWAQASARFKGAALPLAWGVGVGAYLGAGIGVVVGGLIAVVLGLVVVCVTAVVWVGSRVLQAFERSRRRVRGAHFDCPECHERSSLPVYVCPGCGAKHRQLLPGRWGVRRRRCGCDSVSLPVLESNGRHSLTAECPVCSHLMPGAGGIVPEVVVPIVGGPKAGKTAYLASLLLELDDRTQTGVSRLSVVESSRASFDQMAGELRAGRVPTKTLDREVTPAFVAEVRSGSSRSALLYAHDVAGERFQEADAVRGMGSLTRARGALVLIDPFSLQVVGSTLDGQDERRALIDPSAESPQSVVERFLQALRESGRGDTKKLPVAVVLSKADALGGDGGLSPGEHGEAVSQWLEAAGGGNLVRLLRAEFDVLEFFAVSALGRLPAPAATTPAATTPFTPKGTLEPFFWLLRANRIAIDEAAGATMATVTERLQSKDGAKPVVPWPRTPLLAPRPKSGGGYAAGVAASLLIFAGIIGLVAALSTTTNNTASANAGFTGGSGGTGSGNTGSGNTGSGNTGGSGGTGSGNTGSGNTGSGNTGSGSTGSGNTGSGNTGSGNSGSGNSGSGNSGTGNIPASQINPATQVGKMTSVLLSFHQDVVDGDFSDAWNLTSPRYRQFKQSPGQGGYGVWVTNQKTLQPYLEPAGLYVKLISWDPSQGVATVYVGGMGWTQPGSPCTKWQGITWVAYVSGKWYYEPGYSMTPARRAEWQHQASRLMGVGC